MRCLLVLLAAGVLALPGCRQVPEPGPEPGPVGPTPREARAIDQRPTVPIRIGGHELKAWVSDDDVERGNGLAGVPYLEDDEAMLFVYPDFRPLSYWMKGCLIGLDIAYLGEGGRVISIHTLPPPRPGQDDASLPRAVAAAPARYVVEVRAGWFRERGIEVGSRVVLP